MSALKLAPLITVVFFKCLSDLRPGFGAVRSLAHGSTADARLKPCLPRTRRATFCPGWGLARQIVPWHESSDEL